MLLHRLGHPERDQRVEPGRQPDRDAQPVPPVDLAARAGDDAVYVVEQPGRVVRLAGDQQAVVADVNGVEVRIVDLETLIAMKEAAGRPIDLDDVRHLRLLADEQRRDGGGS